MSNSGVFVDRAIRVAVVDDYPLYREGIFAALRSDADILLFGDGASPDDADRLVREHRPDVLLLGINRPGDCFAAADSLAEAHPQLKIIILTGLQDEEHVVRAMKSGVSGYVLKSVNVQQLCRIVRQVHGGACYVTPTLAARILSQQGSAIAAPASAKRTDDLELTRRETEIIRHVADGLTNKEVARNVRLSEKTVKHYMTSIMQKLQVRNRMEVILKASGKVVQGAGATGKKWARL